MQKNYKLFSREKSNKMLMAVQNKAAVKCSQYSLQIKDCQKQGYLMFQKVLSISSSIKIYIIA